MKKSKKNKGRAATGGERHPEDAIYEVKQFISQLTRVQDEKLDKLADDLGLNKEGADFLFDYVYNSQEPTCFDEYLEGLGHSYGEFVKS